jgi:hypothetical protein
LREGVYKGLLGIAGRVGRDGACGGDGVKHGEGEGEGGVRDGFWEMWF